jgi:hypothetical protein
MLKRKFFYFRLQRNDIIELFIDIFERVHDVYKNEKHRL